MTDEPESARVVIEVMAGLLPGMDPDPMCTKRWAITSDEWQAVAPAEGAEPDGQAALLAERNGQAMGYAGLLMMQPGRLNWVRVDWIWL